jgi:antirestriction protein ArdC
MKERGKRPHAAARGETRQRPQPEQPSVPPTHTIYDAQTERTEKVAAALQTLEAGIASLTDSESFKQYLTAMSRLHQYSFGNVCLILSQRRDAQQVAGYRTWQALGRQVKRGEKGIAILVPHKVKIEPEEKGQDPVYIVRNFGVGYVFDVKQTDGEDLPVPPMPERLTSESEAGTALYAQLARYATDQGASVIRQDTGSAYGFYVPGKRVIAVHQLLSGDQAAKTLAHEVAHFTAEHNHFMPREDAETIAEASAFVVLSHAGIDTSQYSFPYISLWAKDKDVLRRNLAGIQKTATTIISGIEDREEVRGVEGVPAVAEATPAPQATHPSPLPTGEETQLPLFEREASEPGNTPDRPWR